MVLGVGENPVRWEGHDEGNPPVYATGSPGDAARVFVVERKGRVMVWREGVAVHPFLDLTPETLSDGSERGLLSIAFAPARIRG